jgi:molybdopterin molybdotransferase
MANAPKLLPVVDARARMLETAVLTGVETVPIVEAQGRVLAEDLTASHTQPPFANSAMDGYAVRAEDVADAPARLKVIGVSAAGRRFDGALGPGQAVRIFTGAPLPDGADAIVIQENVETIVADGPLSVLEAASSGQFVRPCGLDFKSGETLLTSGMLLNAPRTALAAALGHATLKVRSRPSVALLSTGDELVAPGAPCGPDEIVSSNVYGVGALVQQSGGSAHQLGIAPDDPKTIGHRLQEALNSGCDVLVTTGGASVGDHDHVQSVLTGLGAEMAFWKIAMRPGKPMMFGHIGRTLVLGLPGNPVSSLVCARLFLVALIRACLGLPDREIPQDATLTTGLPPNDNREDYVRSALEPSQDGTNQIRPFGRQDSSMLATLARANALIIRPVQAPPAKAGKMVPFIPVDPQAGTWL